MRTEVLYVHDACVVVEVVCDKVHLRLKLCQSAKKSSP